MKFLWLIKNLNEHLPQEPFYLSSLSFSNRKMVGNDQKNWSKIIKRGKVTKTLFAARCEPSLLIARNVGNMYTPSLYGCLSSLLSSGQLNGGEQIGMFSYGSGVCSTFYTIKVNANEQFSKIIRVFKDLPHRLENRTKITPGTINKCQVSLL